MNVYHLFFLSILFSKIEATKNYHLDIFIDVLHKIQYNRSTKI